MKSSRFVVLGAVFAIVPAINAQVVFTNFGPGMTYNTTGGGFNVTGPNVFGGYQEIAAAFVPNASGNLSSADVALGYVTSGSSFTLNLYSDNAGSPGSILDSSALITPTLSFEDPVSCVINVSFPAFSLTSGTQYWLDAVATGSNYNGWDKALTATGLDFRTSPTGSWGTSSDFQPAFDINIGAVPEPGPVFGLLGGGAALLLLRRKK